MARTKSRPGMLIYFDDLYALDRFSNAQVGELVRSMADYSTTGELHDFEDPMVEVVFSMLRHKLDRDRENYENISKRRATAARKAHLQQMQQMQQLQPTETETVTPTETEAETGTPAGAGASTEGFVPPSRDEVEAYAREIDYHIDADRFLAYYAGNGWRMGGNPMRDWRAALRLWRCRDVEKGIDVRRREEPTDEELYRGMSEEDIALLDELAASHWG